MNLVLFLLRYFDRGWWALDYSVYSVVDDSVHALAFLSFIINYSLIFLILLFCLPKNRNLRSNPGIINVGPYFVSFLLILQIVSAVFWGVGIAGGLGEAPFYLYFLFLFSFDFFYFYYALNEKNKKRLFLITCIFVLSNLVRGWASFIVYILVIFWIRNGGIRLKKILYLTPIVFFSLAVTLHVRDVFRGGFSGYDRLISEGFYGVGLYYEYARITFVNIISRFDLYSHYIGVSWMSSLPDKACYPIQENIIYLSLSKVFYFDRCQSLGSILPGFLYDFFIGKGTSYSVGSGFYALKGLEFFGYAFSYYIVLITSVLIARLFLKSSSDFILFGFLVLYIFSQGWNYQYVYMFSGLIFASIYYRVYFLKVR
jgi:hypothetical protein